MLQLTTMIWDSISACKYLGSGHALARVPSTCLLLRRLDHGFISGSINILLMTYILQFLKDPKL